MISEDISYLSSQEFNKTIQKDGKIIYATNENKGENDTTDDLESLDLFTQNNKNKKIIK